MSQAISFAEVGNEEVWYYKFQQGGAMHQAGILAARCIYALENHIERLRDDHVHAKFLANFLADHDHIQISIDEVETNIVIFKLLIW